MDEVFWYESQLVFARKLLRYITYLLRKLGYPHVMAKNVSPC